MTFGAELWAYDHCFSFSAMVAASTSRPLHRLPAWYGFKPSAQKRRGPLTHLCKCSRFLVVAHALQLEEQLHAILVPGSSALRHKPFLKSSASGT